MNASVRFSSPRIAFTAVLWCCAMLMQSVGLLHAYVHPHDAHVHRASHLLSCGSSDEPSSADADCVAVATAPDASGWLHALFAGHDSGSAGCTLFDQLTHAESVARPAHDGPGLRGPVPSRRRSRGVAPRHAGHGLPRPCSAPRSADPRGARPSAGCTRVLPFLTSTPAVAVRSGRWHALLFALPVRAVFESAARWLLDLDFTHHESTPP